MHGDTSTSPSATDVCIIGAGLAGSALAFALSRHGIAVTLVDPRDHCAPTFKAEKLEPDQTALLERLGLLEVLAQVSAPIQAIEVGRRGRLVDNVKIAQRGATYHDMVNAVRRALPANVTQLVNRVTEVTADATRPTVTLTDGRQLACRLVVVATGVTKSFAEQLKLSRRVISDPHSVAFGFAIQRADGAPFPFDALTYLPEQFGDGVDYLTLFRMPGVMRANLFVYTDAKSSFVRELHADGDAKLHRVMPGLTDVIGAYQVVGKVEAKPIDLWVTESPTLDGVVLVGDACQSVCPATGSGLSKVLTDVATLAELAPAWLRSSEPLRAGTLGAYYAHPAKRECDAASLAAAIYRRRLNTDRSLRMRVHRVAELVRMLWQGRRRMAHAS